MTTATLRTTICRKGGFTSSVRPPVELTDAAKRRLLAAYGIPAAESGRYELDHLIPLTAGGSSDVRNLWPQLNVLQKAQESTYVHNDKDETEARAQTALCTGKAQLRTLQRAFAADWTAIDLPPSPRAGQ